MKKISIDKIVYFSFACFLFSCSNKSSSGGTTPPPPPPPTVYEWVFDNTAAWTDEFSTDGLPDANKWGYDVGGNGWGNNELQYYTNGSNAIINSGILKITAKKETYSGRDYTSARMVTKNKADWLYGRFEIKAKLPKGRGTWPAIWMLPTDNAYGGWPNSGEIDIMEHVGYDQGRIHGSIHTKKYNHVIGTQKTATTMVPDCSDQFHVYGLQWNADSIKISVDNTVYFRFANEHSGKDAWPFDQPFHLLLNVAVGGNWGGQKGVEETIFPVRMEVDYVRVYR